MRSPGKAFFRRPTTSRANVVTLTLLAVAAFGGASPARAQVRPSGYLGNTFSIAPAIPARAADPESFFPAGTASVVTALGDTDGDRLREALVAWDVGSTPAGARFCGGLLVKERVGGRGADRWEIAASRYQGPAARCTAQWTAPESGTRGPAILQIDAGTSTESRLGVPAESETVFLDLRAPNALTVLPAIRSTTTDVVAQLATGTPSPASTFVVALQRLTSTSPCDAGGACDFRWAATVGREAERTGPATDNRDDVIVGQTLYEGPYAARPIALTVRDEDPLGYEVVGRCTVDLPAGVFAAAELLRGRLRTVQACGNAKVTLEVRHVATPVANGPGGGELDAEAATRMLAMREITIGRQRIVLPDADRIRAGVVTTEPVGDTVQLILSVALQSVDTTAGWVGRVMMTVRRTGNTWTFEALQNLTLRRVSIQEAVTAQRALTPLIAEPVAASSTAVVGDQGAATPPVPQGAVRGRVQFDHGEVIGGDGDFDQSSVSRLVAQRISAIRACYERELRRDGRRAGKVVVEFTITTTGAVTDVRASENTTGEPAVANCVTGVVGRFRWNPGPVGGSVTFSYPFVFSPQN